MIRTLPVLLLIACAAGPAFAGPVIDRLETSLARNRRLDVVIEATLEGRGEVRIEGTVNGRPVRIRKRVRRAGTKRVRVKLDARKLRLRRLTEPLVFAVTAVVEERAGGRVERAINRSVPVPTIVIPGLGNELTPGATDLFATALNFATGGDHVTDGKHPSLVVHEYPSLDGSLRTHAKGLRKAAKRLLRGSTFGQVDLVGYSLGGLVARQVLADHGSRGVRRVIFLGTPNEGAPIAQIASIGLQGNALSGLAGTLVPGLGDGGGALGDLLGTVVDTDGAAEALRTLHPTYPWAFVSVEVPVLGTQRFALTPELLQTFGALVPGLGDLPLDLSAPLTSLNEVAPAADVAFYAVGYSGLLADTGGPTIGTVDEIDLTALLAGETVDPLALASGEGDGIVPWRSLAFADTPLWAPRVAVTDLGDGTHLTLLADVRAIARVAEILSE